MIEFLGDFSNFIPLDYLVEKLDTIVDISIGAGTAELYHFLKTPHL